MDYTLSNTLLWGKNRSLCVKRRKQPSGVLLISQNLEREKKNPQQTKTNNNCTSSKALRFLFRQNRVSPLLPKEIKRRACALPQWDRNLPKLTLVRHVMKTKVPERWRNYLNPVGVCVRVLLSCSPCSCTFLLLLFCFCCVIFPFAWSWCLECCFCFWLCFHFPATSSEVHQDSGGDILRALLFSWLNIDIL